MMLDLKKLSYLEAVYNCKSFTKASETIFVSQPTISAAISSMEQDFGVKLISRSSKNVIFTAEGNLFVQQIQRILSLCNETEQMMKDLSSSANQHLRIGISQATSTFLLPKIFSKFMNDHPNAKLQFTEGDMYTHIEALKNESLDLVYNALPTIYEAENLDTIEVSSSRLHVIVPSSHSYAKLKRIPLELLAKKNLAVLGTTSRTATSLINAFDRAGIQPEIAFSCNHYSCLIEVLIACDYIGIMNVMEGQPFPHYRGFTLRPIVGVDPIPMGVIFPKNKYMSKLGRDFISFVKNTYQSV